MNTFANRSLPVQLSLAKLFTFRWQFTDKYADCFSFDEDGYLTYSQGDKKQLSREASSVLKGLLTVISQQTVTNGKNS